MTITLMLIVQKYHSIHEIDSEFIPSLEVLLQDESPSFNFLIEKHDTAPASDVFTYFLFFGPTQNTPIGFAQLCLRQLPGDKLISWQKKLKFWKTEHKGWKQLSWKVGNGNSGLFVFDPRFARTGREKIQELINEYCTRSEIKAQEIFFLKGLQDFQVNWDSAVKWSKDRYVLEPMVKPSKSYQDYLGSLNKEVSAHIKKSWKNLQQKSHIELGDYPHAKETPPTLPIPREQLDAWEKLGAQVLTFEKDLKVLGCLLILKGKNGNVFFEPFPFEPHDEAIVTDDLYTQYALLKFFEMPEARKCHMLKFGTKLVFDEKEDLKFFQDQGFQFKTVTQSFFSKLPNLGNPL